MSSRRIESLPQSHYKSKLGHLIGTFIERPNPINYSQLIAYLKNPTNIRIYSDIDLALSQNQTVNVQIVRAWLICTEPTVIQGKLKELCVTFIAILLSDKKNSFAWDTLAFILTKLNQHNDLPLESVFSQEILLRGKQTILGACYGNALICDETSAISWQGLGTLFYEGLIFSQLPLAVQRLFANGNTLSAAALVLHCYNESLRYDYSDPLAWFNIGLSFEDGADFSELSDDVKKLFPNYRTTPSGQNLRFYCHSRSLSFDNTDPIVLCSLGSLFATNQFSFNSLDEDIKNLFLRYSKILSLDNLPLFCYELALYSNKNEAHAWYHLSKLFYQDLPFMKLSARNRSLFPSNVQEGSSLMQRVYCLLRTLTCTSNYALAWRDLGDLLAQGLPFAAICHFDLNIKELFPKFANISSQQALIAYCHSRANTNRSPNKRMADESLENPITKKQNTNKQALQKPTSMESVAHLNLPGTIGQTTQSPSPTIPKGLQFINFIPEARSIAANKVTDIPSENDHLGSLVELIPK